jgi:hypothetical protein
VPRRFLRAAARGDARLMRRASLGHVWAGLALAVAASDLLLSGQMSGLWLLGEAVLAILAGMGAYALLQRKHVARPGALALVSAQLAALACGCTLVGPRAALLLLVPAACWLALRLGGRPVALACGVGAVAIYLAFVVAAADGAYRPALALDARAQTVLGTAAGVLGVALLLVALVSAAAAQERSEAAARARLYELRLIRAEMARLREQAEHDGQVLEEALAGALRGRGIDPIHTEGALSPVAEGINAVADRMATLQKDREDRLRLEGALRTVIRAVERGWLGLAWTWPEASGTMLDELVALLRTPRPREKRPQPVWSDDVPTFLTLPTIGASLRPAPPHAEPGASQSGIRASRAGWDDLLARG